MITLTFFFNDTATTEIYTLSLHDALPIFVAMSATPDRDPHAMPHGVAHRLHGLRRAPDDLDVSRLADPPLVEAQDRKSTRLNSSHANISYAVFCLKTKTKRHRLRSIIAVP